MDTSRIALSFLLLLAGMTVTAQDASVQLITPDSVIAGEEFLIEVMIIKGSNNSFAKLQLDIPPAFKVDSSKSDSARFNFSNSQAKYIWDRMPAKDTLNVTFKASTDAAFSGARGVNGVFAYILNNTKAEVRIPTNAIKVQQPVLASVSLDPLVEKAENFTGEESSQAKTEQENKAKAEALYAAQKAHMEEEKKTEAAAQLAAQKAHMEEKKKAEAAAQLAAQKAHMEEEKKAETAARLAAQEAKIAEEKKAEQAAIAAAQKAKAEEKKSVEPPAEVANKSTPSAPKIEFRVQVVASAVKVNISNLKAKYAITEKIQEEFHNGLWKYTAGSHSSYGAAKSKIPVYRNGKGVKGAFLTAYNNGQRITVKDAINQTK